MVFKYNNLLLGPLMIAFIMGTQQYDILRFFPDENCVVWVKRAEMFFFGLDGLAVIKDWVVIKKHLRFLFFLLFLF